MGLPCLVLWEKRPYFERATAAAKRVWYLEEATMEKRR